ncbi:MAG TPA: CopD family protein [Gemmatimonadaceae bacterium]|nr:CopD family protein [Gemmatimonadaceae bacterium]
MQAEPLLQWSDPVKEFVGFVALFLGAGGIGFRYFALRGWRIDTDRAFYDDAARRAAGLGFVGVILSLILAVTELPGLAARKHLSAVAFAASDPATMMQLGFLLLAVIGYAMAAGRIRAGWVLAAIGVVAGALRLVFLGQWSRLVNPVHSLAAGLWLGTLFVLVVAGLSALLRHEPTRDRRGAIAADMVNGFSPLALSMGGVVVVFGLITAWRHLHVLSNLWSTPYGDTLIVKLILVAVVFGLGAWNWRRQRPTLGTESAASSVRRSATAELTVAMLVLVVTAIVVSLPAPKG